jgi:YVTN family beta-propeller protein
MNKERFFRVRRVGIVSIAALTVLAGMAGSEVQGASPASAQGTVTQVIPPSYSFDGPGGISTDGTHTWVVNNDGQSVTELDTSNGAVVQVIPLPGYEVSGGSDFISSDGTHVWVTNMEGDSVYELDAATGAVIQEISAASYDFVDPYAVSSDGTDVWVTNLFGNSVTELDAATGGLVQVISGSSYGFNSPYAISSDGTHVWVANSGDNSVTELDAATGALVQVISGGSTGFDNPRTIAADGTHVWVGNALGTSVTELDAATGAVVGVISFPSYEFNDVLGLSSDGTDVWVTDSEGNTVTELDAASGAVVQVISGGSYGFAGPDTIASDGSDVWVANGNGNSVTELDASTGDLMQVLSGNPDGFNHPSAVASDGTDVWVANYQGNSVTELDATTGGLVQVISGSSYDFNEPSAIASDGSDVWVVNYQGNSVTELDATTGGLVQVISGSSYEFYEPSSIASDGTHVWVVNGDGYVTELDARTGALVQAISGSGGEFSGPRAISSDGTDVWVANGDNNSVTELDAATGALVQVISSASFGFDNPIAISSDGTDVWVANSGFSTVQVGNSVVGYSVTELSAATGGLVQVISGASYGFGNPWAISSDGTDVWVANLSDSTVTELDATSGALVDVISGIGPGPLTAISSDSANAWVTTRGNTVTQIATNSPILPGQTITITSTPPSLADSGGPTYSVSATGGGSGNPVTFSSATPFVCLVSGTTVSFVGGGICTIDANQAGNLSYAPARTATQTFEVDGPPLEQTITFTSMPPALTFPGGPTYSVSATGGGSGNPVTFSSATTLACLVSGATVSFVGGGTCTIDADQAGNASYPPAQTATQTFEVDPCTSPVFTSPDAATASAGTPFTDTVMTCHPLTPNPKFKATGLPPGLKLSSNGNNSATISGTPSSRDSGVYSATLTAIVPNEPAATQKLAITVDNTALFRSKTVLTFHTGSAFTFAVTTTSGWPIPSITTGSLLPIGVTLQDNHNGTASLAGTPGPGTGGVYRVTFSATTSAGVTANQNFVLTVYQAPALTSAASDTISQGVPMTPFRVTASGYPAPTLKAAGLPMGLTLSGNTISGTTKAAAGTYTVTIIATSKAGSTRQPFTLTVDP